MNTIWVCCPVRQYLWPVLSCTLPTLLVGKHTVSTCMPVAHVARAAALALFCKPCIQNKVYNTGDVLITEAHIYACCCECMGCTHAYACCGACRAHGMACAEVGCLMHSAIRVWPLHVAIQRFSTCTGVSLVLLTCGLLGVLLRVAQSRHVLTHNSQLASLIGQSLQELLSGPEEVSYSFSAAD